MSRYFLCETFFDFKKSSFCSCTKKVNWLKDVFEANNVVDNLIEMVLDVFKNLDPGLDFCFQAGMKLQTDPLLYLKDLKVTYNSFLKFLDELFRSLEETGKTRRMYIFNNKPFFRYLFHFGFSGSRHQTRVRELAKLIYAPFKTILQNYQSMATSKLLQELESNTTTSKDILDELRLISLSVPKLICSFKTASALCLDLTEGCTYDQLTNAFEECLVQYLDRFSALMKRLEKRKSAAHSWNILQQSLQLNQNCGDLLLNLEDLDISLAIEFLDKTKPFLNVTDNAQAVQQHHLYLLDTIKMKKLVEFHARVKQNPTLFTILFKHIQSTLEDLQNCTFKILFHPIQEQLVAVSSAQMLEQVWTSTSAGADTKEPDMPDFSFSPQEYITQIGQYLMTMPQHLEPYMTNDNPSLSRALQARVFPFCGSVTSKSGDNNTPADFLLNCIARATCQTYLDHILKIPSLSVNSTKQLYTDIGKYNLTSPRNFYRFYFFCSGYIGDIISDLGHPLTDSLASFNRLLKASPKDLPSIEEPQKWIQTVKTMRGLN